MFELNRLLLSYLTPSQLSSCSLFSSLQLRSGLLVDSAGIIYPPAFYNYLTAWRSLRTLEYGAVRNLLRPQPHKMSVSFPPPFGTWNKDLFLRSVDRSAPLEFTQMPFYLHGVRDSATMLQVVRVSFSASLEDLLPSLHPLVPRRHFAALGVRSTPPRLFAGVLEIPP